MAVQTYILLQHTFNPVVILLVFFSALFVYNTSLLSFAFYRKSPASPYTFKLKGDAMPVIFCSVSLALVIIFLTRTNHLQLAIVAATGILSLLYMMPFRRNEFQIRGLRNNPVLKNIVLSIIWASATVLLPVADFTEGLPLTVIIIMLIRRFLFIYALTVVYDLRDREADKRAGMETLALKLGQPTTKLVALLSIALFVLSAWLDPYLDTGVLKPVKNALLYSAIPAALIIIFTNIRRKKAFYTFVVDGAILIQFFMVLLWQ
jgi:4-hydroxybenzoate polyprenyltransferase